MTDSYEQRRDAAEREYRLARNSGPYRGQDFKAGADWGREQGRAEKCPRCGDMFYDPRTIIKDKQQHAAEWEEVAKRLERLTAIIGTDRMDDWRRIQDAERECERLTAENSELRKKLEKAGK